MFNHLIKFIFFSLIISFSASANNPFAKSESLDIGKDVSWQLDKKAGVATKTKADKKGSYYHLKFDNKQLELLISSDAKGSSIKKYDQLDIKDVKIDGTRSVLFQWCLDNQESQDRFLQQGLKVRSDVCVSDGSKGSFVMRLDGGTLASLKNGRELTIVLKPFRTPLELHFDLADFKTMVSELNARPAPVVASIAPVSAIPAGAAPKKMCFSKPPAKYKSISSIEYNCVDNAAKRAADNKIDSQVKQQKSAEEKQRKLAAEKKRQEQAAKLEQEKKRQAEAAAAAAAAAAIAASEAKQAEIGGEITSKMVSMCEKYWNKGEHRCYCQKYIEYAPAEIQANSSCQ
jgi:hypothetical protein